MKYCIEPKECVKQNVPIDTVFYIASLYFDKPIDSRTFTDVCSRGFIEYAGFDALRNPVNVKLTQAGVDFIESIFLNSEFSLPNSEEDRFDKLAKQMWELFPEGKKPGTNLMWKDSKPMIAKRLKTLVKKYKVDFTDEQALNATKKYIESFNGDYRFMQVLRYFIWKRDNDTGTETSQLLSYIENAGQQDISDEDWRDEVR